MYDIKNNVNGDSKWWKLWKRRKDLISMIVRRIDNMDKNEKQTLFMVVKID